MNCPKCKSVALIDDRLEEGLPSRRCPQCEGQWISGVHYFTWLDAHKNEVQTTPSTDSIPHGSDAARAKLCPECGRLLTRARVGHGIDFSIDRCGHCGGFWLDATEWEALKLRGLHGEIHQMFSSAWQAEVARAERERSHEHLLLQKLGEADFAEARRIRRWLDAHPHRAELYALLMDGAEGISPPARPERVSD